MSKEIQTDSPSVPKPEVTEEEEYTPPPPPPTMKAEKSYKLPVKPAPTPAPTPKPTNKRCNLAALNSDFNQYGVYGYNL